MGKKKGGGKGQKKLNAKAKADLKLKRHAKNQSKLSKKKKQQTNSVKSNMKKLTNNKKKLDLLNAEIANVLKAPTKTSDSTSVKVAAPVDGTTSEVSAVEAMVESE